MLIPVLYKDGKRDMVIDIFLGKYIESGEIIQFRRSDGWVVVGVHPVRGPGGIYKGPERRRSLIEKMF